MLGLAMLLVGCGLIAGAFVQVTAGGLGQIIIAVFAVCAVGLMLVAPYFRRIPNVQLRPRRILAVGAQPDDLELACGATLAKLVDEGHVVQTVVLCAGAEGGHAEVRAIEAQRGSRYLRAAHTRVHDFEDTMLALSSREMVRVLEEAIADFQPDIILTHSAHDQHQDHEAVHHATMRAARRSPSILC